MFAGVRAALHAAVPAVVAEPDVDRLAVGDAADWQAMSGYALRHGVLPLLYKGAKEAGVTLPDPFEVALRGWVMERTVRSMALVQEAGRLRRVLDDAGIPFLILKGAALTDAYGGIALRPFVDNDVLIRAEDFQRLEAVLVGEAGFMREARSPLQKRGYLAVHGQYTFGRRDGETIHTLDLHTSILPLGYTYAESVDVLLGRARTVHLMNVDLSAPSWEDEVIILAMNGLKDRWDRLRLVLDVAAVAARGLDWDLVFTRAEAARCSRTVHVALRLCRNVLGMPLPAEVEARVLADRRAGAIAAGAADRLTALTPVPERSWRERMHFFLATQDGLRGQLRYSAFSALRRVVEPLLKGTGVASTSLE